MVVKEKKRKHNDLALKMLQLVQDPCYTFSVLLIHASYQYCSIAWKVVGMDCITCIFRAESMPSTCEIASRFFKDLLTRLSLKTTFCITFKVEP